MNEHFDIIGGIVYLDKSLYTDSLLVDNDLSKLTGSSCVDMFKTRPRIQSGIETITIDFTRSDNVSVAENPALYIHGLQEHYHNQVRGHLVIDIGEGDPIDMMINTY